MPSLIPSQRYQIWPNWQSNIDMVNKNKKCDREFWSNFSILFTKIVQNETAINNNCN